MLKGILITALIASLTGVNTKAVRVYPLTAICTEVNQNKNTVTFADFNGEGWKIEECECWEKGDVVAMLISDNATPNNVHDDVIIDIYYQGRQINKKNVKKRLTSVNLFAIIKSSKRDRADAQHTRKERCIL